MPTNAEPQSIDEVIARLRDIVQWSRDNASPAGYFAALYLKVTIRIKEGIQGGVFEDDERMERFDILFASRYIDAFEQFRSGEISSECWQFAFDATGRWRPIVLQHLLLGINAHINLDLGIAAARTSQGPALDKLKADFDRVNAILADLVDGVQQDLAAIWPAMRIFNRYLGSVQEGLINFSIETARDMAWELAQQLDQAAAEAWPNIIQGKDDEVTVLASLIRFPGALKSMAFLAIRLGERGSVRDKIAILE